MQNRIRWVLVGLAAIACAACGGSKQQQASSPSQQQALSQQEASELQQASIQQQSLSQQLQADRQSARAWYSETRNACATEIPQVYISTQDSVDGVKVMYYTTSLAFIDPLRKSVYGQLGGELRQARASGGMPMTPGKDLPPVSIKTIRNPDGVTVVFTAKDPLDVEIVRDRVRDDVKYQLAGHCSMLRVPESAILD